MPQGGAKRYIVGGQMSAGFAFVDYPADRSSRVMTFIVNEAGVVYQKDPGRKTDVLAKAMKEYNPDSSGRRPKTWLAPHLPKLLNELSAAQDPPQSLTHMIAAQLAAA